MLMLMFTVSGNKFMGEFCECKKSFCEISPYLCFME